MNVQQAVQWTFGPPDSQEAREGLNKTIAVAEGLRWRLLNLEVQSIRCCEIIAPNCFRCVGWHWLPNRLRLSQQAVSHRSESSGLCFWGLGVVVYSYGLRLVTCGSALLEAGLPDMSAASVPSTSGLTFCYIHCWAYFF